MVGSTLRAAREKRGLTVKDIENETSIRATYIDAIEKGDYNPTINLCIAICRVLGVTLNDLFWEE